MDLENATDYRVQFILNPEQPEEPATTIMQDREGSIYFMMALFLILIIFPACAIIILLPLAQHQLHY